MVAGMSLTALGCWYVPTPVAWDCDPGLQGKLLLRGRGEGAPSYGEEPRAWLLVCPTPRSLRL
jgi:hypothetical protein